MGPIPHDCQLHTCPFHSEHEAHRRRERSKTHDKSCYDCRDCIDRCKDSMSHTTDGPVTPFVLHARSMDLAARGAYSSNTCANALYELLIEFGVMRRSDPNEILAASSEF